MRLSLIRIAICGPRALGPCASASALTTPRRWLAISAASATALLPYGPSRAPGRSASVGEVEQPVAGPGASSAASTHSSTPVLRCALQRWRWLSRQPCGTCARREHAQHEQKPRTRPARAGAAARPRAGAAVHPHRRRCCSAAPAMRQPVSSSSAPVPYSTRRCQRVRRWTWRLYRGGGDRIGGAAFAQCCHACAPCRASSAGAAVAAERDQLGQRVGPEAQRRGHA